MHGVFSVFDQIRKDLEAPLEPYTRAANIALPFLYLYQPTAAVFSLGLGIRKVYHLSAGENKDPWTIATTLFQLGLNYASPVGGAILSSGTLLGKQVCHMRGHLSNREWNRFGEEFFGAMITTIHLFAVFNSSPTVIAASIVLRSLAELKESYSFYEDGKWPEALSSLVLSVIHASSARPYISESWRQYFSKSLKCEEKESFSPVIENLSLEDFPVGSLSFLDFSGIVFKGCSFSKATIESSTFDRCRFVDCQFDSISLADCQFNCVQLDHTRVSSCGLKQVHLYNAKIQNSFFTNCVFKDTAFLPKLNYYTFFSQKIMPGQKNDCMFMAKENSIENTNFSFCEFDQMRMSQGKMQNAFFTDCTFKDVDFFHSTFEKIIFDRLSLHGTQFNDSTFKEINWKSSDFTESIFFGVQIENFHIESSSLTDTFLGEAESAFQIENANLRKITKPIVSIRWDFDSPGQFAQIICKRLKENGIVPLKYKDSLIESEEKAFAKEMETMMGSLEYVQVASARCIAEKLFAFRTPGSNLDRIYNRAAVIAKSAQAHLLPGGEDIEPELYGKDGENGNSLFRLGGAASLTELAILHHADRANQEVLGICRGAQLINVYYNGTICQHVPGQSGVQVLRAAALTSSKAEELKRELFGSAEKLYAVSMHHQCAEKIGSGLHVLYESEGGVPKILVHENGRVIGAQCHPEEYKDPKCRDSAPYFQGLFQRLVRRS